MKSLKIFPSLKKENMNKILRPYTYLLSVHVAALLLLSVIRLFFYIAVKEQITGDAAGNASWICAAFLRGLWFDNVIACYITQPFPYWPQAWQRLSICGRTDLSER